MLNEMPHAHGYGALFIFVQDSGF